MSPDNIELAQRQAVIEVAKTWLRTPYRHMARIKGAGVDCLTLLAEVYHEAGLIEKVQIPYYPQDFMHHRDTERYLTGLLEYTQEVQEPKMGDIALWKFGRVFSHAAIVVEWPIVIHAYVARNVTIEDASAAAWLSHIGENGEDKGKIRPRRFFSYWGK